MIKKILGKILKLLLILLLCIVVIYNFLNINNSKGYSKFFGYKVVPVQEYNEQGKIEKNDIIIAKKKKERYKENDLVIVRYNKALHFEKIIEVDNGEYTTKGDGNYKGNENISHDQIEGVVLFKIDKIGIILNVAKSNVVTILIFISAIVTYSYNMHTHNKKIKRRFKQSSLNKK